MQHAVFAVLPTRQREQAVRLGRIVAIRRQRRRGPRLREDVGDGEPVDSVKDGIVDALPVDRLGDRAAHANVAQLRAAQVDPEMAPIRRSVLARRRSRRRSQGAADRVSVHVRIDVDLVSRELGKERVYVGDDFPDDFLELGRAAKIPRVGHEDQRRSVIPLFEQIRTAGERMALKSAALRFGRFANRCAGSGG